MGGDFLHQRRHKLPPFSSSPLPEDASGQSPNGGRQRRGSPFWRGLLQGGGSASPGRRRGRLLRGERRSFHVDLGSHALICRGRPGCALLVAWACVGRRCAGCWGRRGVGLLCRGEVRAAVGGGARWFRPGGGAACARWCRCVLGALLRSWRLRGGGATVLAGSGPGRPDLCSVGRFLGEGGAGFGRVRHSCRRCWPDLSRGPQICALEAMFRHGQGSSVLWWPELGFGCGWLPQVRAWAAPLLQLR